MQQFYVKDDAGWEGEETVTESLASCGAGPSGELVELRPVPAVQAEFLSPLRALGQG